MRCLVAPLNVVRFAVGYGSRRVKRLAIHCLSLTRRSLHFGRCILLPVVTATVVASSCLLLTDLRGGTNSCSSAGEFTEVGNRTQNLNSQDPHYLLANSNVALLRFLPVTLSGLGGFCQLDHGLKPVAIVTVSPLGLSWQHD